MQRIVFLDRATIGPSVELPRPGFAHAWTEHAATGADEVAKRLAGATIAITNKAPIRKAALAGLPDLQMIAIAATVTAVGRPRATSAANVGPESAASRASPPSRSRATSWSSRPVPSSSPFVAQTRPRTPGPSAASVSRKAWLGTAIRISSHERARSRSATGVTPAGMGTPGR